MSLQTLHDAIRTGDYKAVETIIFTEPALNPPEKWNGQTAIEVCIAMVNEVAQKTGKPCGLVYNDMLKKLIFPRGDQFLMGNGAAKENDRMLIDDNGGYQIIPSDQKHFDQDHIWQRRVGLDGHHLLGSSQGNFSTMRR